MYTTFLDNVRESPPPSKLKLSNSVTWRLITVAYASKYLLSGN